MDYSSYIVLSIFLYLFYKWVRSYVNEPRNQPPTVARFDLKQQTKFLDLNIRHKEYVKMSQQYGVGIFTTTILGFHKIVIMNDWNVMKEALVVQADVFSARPKFFIIDLLGRQTDIATSTGPMWKEKRRFTMHQLRNLGFGKNSMEVHIQNEITRFIEYKLEKDDGKEIEINELIQMPVLNILWGLIAGKTYDYDNEGMKQLLRQINSDFTLLMKTTPIIIFPFLRFVPFDPFSLKELIKKLTLKGAFYDNEIEEHITTFQRGDIRDFIDSYVEKMNENLNKGYKETVFEKQHLIGIMENMFSAGVETTATTIEWALMYMALWPEIQQKVQQELDEVIGKARQPCLSDRSQLPYVDATIMEVQRYANVIPVSFHRPMVDANVLGYNISKTTTVIRNIYAIHFNESLWGDPHVFRPERFINSEGKVEKPEYFIPFSTGARHCLGEPFARIQLFLFFTCIMQRFKFSVPTGKPPPSLEAIVTLTQNPKPFSLVVESR